ncbi:ArsC/Spx/MgsR family protein [Ectobacillus ponti]|uniref:Transcriptional regulator Spx n=1 Tax=Ectobacillus ponti TaxID=2961894 RepID=A0AA42BUZ9_9BACI|nr:ArsC/Spx/MgsR family protein [Ectobacillus ponti]MCP8971068.1 hypothetical protein [Ectobacillus ponti]
MNQWVLYGKRGNPAFDIMKAWMVNNGMPYEGRSIYDVKRADVEQLAALAGDARKLVYPDAFSFSMINPQRQTEKGQISIIQDGNLSQEEIVDKIMDFPSLLITPLLTDGKRLIIGYDLETLVNTFRFVKVKDVTMA